MSDEQNETSEPVELTIEDLFQEQIKDEEVKHAQAAMLLDVGTYTTTPPFTLMKMGEDKNGRKFARYFGTVTLGDKSGKIGFGLSWDHKHAKDADGNETDKPDFLYKLYAMAVKAFKAAYGREAENVGEVLAYLRDYPIRLRVIQTADGDNLVVSISAVRG